MAQQESGNDMPIMVGAIVVGLIACGVFFFMRQDPTPAPTPAEPVRAPLSAQAVTPTMIETTGKPAEQQAGGTGLAGRSGGGAAGPAVAGASGGQPVGPVAAGVSGG